MIKELFFRKRIPYRMKTIEDGSFSFTKEGIDSFIRLWNIALPIDRWYRKKYNLRFNSEEHRGLSFEDMMFEYREEMLFNKKFKSDTYIPNVDDFIKEAPKKEITKEDFLKEFEDIDLSKYDDVK